MYDFKLDMVCMFSVDLQDDFDSLEMREVK